MIPIQYPLNSGESFNQIVDALRMVMYEFPATGGKPEKNQSQNLKWQEPMKCTMHW